jgi:protein involved in polysaccharide export with SLBB domain
MENIFHDIPGCLLPLTHLILKKTFKGATTMRWTKLVILTLLFPLAACSHAVKGQSSLEYADTQKVPLPPLAEAYRIQAGDQLDIKFFYNPSLNEQVTVRTDGLISLQLIKSTEAAGLTPEQLTDRLKKEYSDQLKEPDIVVIVRSFASQRVFVDGEVAKPGLIPLTLPTTVLQAISQAGGILYTGQASDVLVIRRGTDNRPLAMVVNLEKVRNGTDMSQDIYMKPFDIVYVPKTAITSANLWIEQYLSRMVPRIGFTAAYPVGSGVMGVDTTSTIITPAK